MIQMNTSMMSNITSRKYNVTAIEINKAKQKKKQYAIELDS